MNPSDSHTLVARIRAAIGPNWGLFALVVATVVGFINVARPRNQLHYIIFSGGAESLWRGVTPYGNDFGTGLGWYIYSPSCGLFFYGLFSWMPFGLGLFLYMAISIPIFLYGLKSFLEACVPSYRDQFHSNSWLQWMPVGKFPEANRRDFNLFWFWASYCVLGCLTADKLELIIVGVTLFNLSLMIRNKHIWLAAFLWAMMTNWKLQPLPLVGLISIVLLVLDWKRFAKFITAFLVSLAFWYAAPIPFLGLEKTKDFMHQWSTTLSGFIETHWFDFQHILKMPYYLGLNPTLRMLNIAGAIGGVLFAGVTFIYVLRLRRFSEGVKIKLGLFVATLWGQWYAVGFSPMSQSNAFILALPIFLIGTVLLASAPSRDAFALSTNHRHYLRRGLLVAGLIGYLLTSDIFGKTVRQFVSNAGFCAYAFLIGAITVTWACFKLTAKAETSVSAQAD